jgi:hypothetical protein
MDRREQILARARELSDDELDELMAFLDLLASERGRDPGDEPGDEPAR